MSRKLKLSIIAILFFGMTPFFCSTPTAHGEEASLGGFIPFVGIGLTDEFTDGSDGTFFQAKPQNSLIGDPLSGNGSPYYDIALLDTGAATHILTSQASGPNGFDIDGNGFDGTNIQRVGGATGLIDLKINDPLALFAAGLGDRTGSGTALTMNTNTFRGQSSIATLSAPTEWKLPNIVGLPMAAQHAIHIKNSEPQLFELNGRTVRTPQVDFIELGTGNQQGIIRRTDLKARSGPAFVAGPLFIQDILGILTGAPFHENPASPTIVENGALFIDVDMTNGDNFLNDKELLFDTGADLTVVSQLTAARLGFDPILDKPDFVLEVEGSGGVSSGIPGFYLDELKIDTVGGSFVMTNVPIAVLDVTNPNDPGNTIAGILGMHLFNGRDLVIDVNTSIGQGGAGPSLYISDRVTSEHQWSSTSSAANWTTPTSWSDPGTPANKWVVNVSNLSGSVQVANVTTDSTVFQMTVAGNMNNAMTVEIASGTTLTTFGETRIEAGGQIIVNAGAKLDAQFININGGTLTGGGEIFVGTGPINGAVRNLAGRIEPGDGIGTLAITGDLSNLEAGTIAFDLEGVIAGTEHDQIALDRYAFLAGTLEVSLEDGYTPSMGDQFTLITANEGVVGSFDQLTLPSEFQWEVNYLANTVVLEVTGLGSLEGDFNNDGNVNAADLEMWKTSSSLNGSDFLAWQRNYGTSNNVTNSNAAAATVPEPGSLALLLISLALATIAGRLKSEI